MGFTNGACVSIVLLLSLISTSLHHVASSAFLPGASSSFFGIVNSSRRNHHDINFVTHRRPTSKRRRRRRRIALGAVSKQIIHEDKEKEEDENLSNQEISRYSRHLVLSNVGIVGQKIFKNASVLVVGAGGLGSPCLLYLAAAGIGHIGIVDADIVDESNLQRQVIHGTSTVGMTKCQSAQQRIHDLNPNVQVRLYEEEFTSSSALRILGNGFDKNHPYDVVIDGSDNFPTKYLINDACAIVGTPWVYSAILAFEGQLSVFNWKNNGPDYRDLLPTPPPPGDVPSCAEGGVLGVLPGTMGCLQATETIKILLEKQREGSMMDICSGRVLIFDALKMKFNHVGLARTEGREAITELIDYQGFCGGPQQAAAQQQSPSPSLPPSSTAAAASEAWIKTGGRTMDEVPTAHDTASSANSHKLSFHAIEPQVAMEKLLNGWSPWVLDVRLPTESDIVSLPFTDRLVPHRTVRIRDVPKTGDVLIYCKAGVRGKKACHTLIEQGVEPERLYNLEGGILRWQKDVDPSMPRY